MKIILRITKLQLLNLLSSPISWVVLVLFGIYSGISFADIAEQLNNQAKVGEIRGSATWILFFGIGSGYALKIQNLLFLFIPILSMGLISSEKNSGTIKLLYSSPIKLRSIVLGKYLAIILFSALMIFFIAIVLLAGSLFIENMDWGLALSLLLTFYLLIATYCAIALFMSSLTRYQVVSGIATIALIYVLNLLGGLVEDNGILKNVLSWFSISQHANNAMRGFIVSSDILYFIIISALFLFLTISKMHADRVNSGQRLKIWIQMTASFAAIAGIIYVITLPRLTYQTDLTQTEVHTLAPEGREILEQLNQTPIKITFYENIIGGRELLPANRRSYTKKMYDRYIRFLPDMQFDYKFYYGPKRSDWFRGEGKKFTWKQKAERTADHRNLDFNQIKSIEEQDEWMVNYLSMSEFNLGLGHCFEYNGKKSVVNTRVNDPIVEAMPVDYLTALNHFITPEKKVVFINGHRERNINSSKEKDWKLMANDYGQRSALVRMGFKVEEINLVERDIPANTDILVIADPMLEYSQEEIAMLQAYIQSGGNLLITGEVENATILNPLLHLLGVEINKETINTTNSSMPNPKTRLGIINSEAPAQLLAFIKKESLLVEGASSIEVVEDKGFDIVPYLSTDKSTDYIVNENGQKEFGSYPLMLAMSRQQNGKTQNILVSGDADFLSNKEMMNTRMKAFTANVLCYKSMFKWLNNGEYPLKLEVAKPTDNKIHLSNEKVSIYKVIYIWIIPLLFGAFGAIYLMRRRRM